MAKPVQIPGVAPVVLISSDLDDPNLTKLNEVFRQIVTSLNALVGANGKIPFTVSIDMQGNAILNIGFSQTAPTATVGGGQVVPATVAGYITATVGGVAVKIPYFKA
jgi:hypothetical protein